MCVCNSNFFLRVNTIFSEKQKKLNVWFDKQDIKMTHFKAGLFLKFAFASYEIRSVPISINTKYIDI